MTSIINIPKSKFISKLKCVDFYNLFLNITLILLIIATLLLIINPARYILSINAGIELFFYSVFPSLLPFLFLSKLLDGLGAFNKLNKIFSPLTTKIYNCPSIASYPMIMSIISGYPLGVKIVGDLHSDKKLSDFEVKKVVALSSTSGPIFIIGSVGARMLNDTRLGLLIFIAHILGALLTAFFFTRKKSPKGKNQTPPNSTPNSSSILSSATLSTITSILTVAVYVSIFYMFIDMAYDLKILDGISCFFQRLFLLIKINPDLAGGISSGLIEMTRGCKEIASLGNNFYSLVCCTGLISFGGLSIILQSLTFLSGTNLKAGYFIFLKSCQAIISMVVALILGLIFL